jgi:hypothetical protein
MKKGSEPKLSPMSEAKKSILSSMAKASSDGERQGVFGVVTRSVAARTGPWKGPIVAGSMISRPARRSSVSSTLARNCAVEVLASMS